MSVRLESNGKYWVAAWFNSAGKVRRKSLGSKAQMSKRQATQECRRMADDMARTPGFRDAGKAPMLHGWLDWYLANRSDVAESTLTNHKFTIARMKEFFVDVRMDKITRQRVAEYKSWLYRHQGFGAVTSSKHMSLSKLIFKYAVDTDNIPFSPFDREKVKVHKVEKAWRYVTLEEFGKILDACDEDRWRLIFMLARLAGLRRNEIGRVEWSWIDWQARRLTIMARDDGVTTTKKALRSLPLVPKLYEVLLAVRQKNGLIVEYWTNENVERTARRVIARAGVKDWAKPLQTLRANCETDWLSQYPVFDVCDWMGHDPSVSRKHYHQTRTDVWDRVTGQEKEKAVMGGGALPKTDPWDGVEDAMWPCPLSVDLTPEEAAEWEALPDKGIGGPRP